MTNKSRGRGGYRPNAGRKSLSDKGQIKKPLSVYLTGGVRGKLLELAKAEGVSTGALITRWVEEKTI